MKRKNREPESVESRGSGDSKSEASKNGGRKTRRRQDEGEQQRATQGRYDHDPSCSDTKCELCGDGELEISVVVRRDASGGSANGGADDGDESPSATDLLKLALSEKSVYERARDADYPLQRPESGDGDGGTLDPALADRESHQALRLQWASARRQPTDLDMLRLRATCVRELGGFVKSGDILDDAEKAYEDILEVGMPEGLSSEDVARWVSRRAATWGGLWRTMMEKHEPDSDSEDEAAPSQQNASAAAAVWMDSDEQKLVEKAVASLDKASLLTTIAIITN
ncbi:hypothetical protein M427DRAFT_69963 [Gonapodya prolifera JEL478]|uniref:Uncharacterized protein n=1 Tax=Gonapodya prolifera (strain JEL478) TaxID=1344416 RepID=A0A139AFL3_GONPJ|nr:hypothetical protein M427DRAFT_69963 [Gonapodya prolifera JEL478]|eukprot:KXS15612.1 hypothetical protein M427DRAFT_69963 [Gonapodya prolifera JEL478]